MPFGEADLRVIADFAAQLGLPARAARDGSFSFVFSESGTLTLTPSFNGGRNCMTLSRRPERLDVAGMTKVLAGAGWQESMNVLVQACLTGENEVLLTIGIARDALSLPGMDAVLQTLMTKIHAVA